MPLIPGFITSAIANYVEPFASGFGIRLRGATSGAVRAKPPDVAGTAEYTLPDALPAVSGYALVCSDAGLMSWAQAGVTDHGALTGLGDDGHTQYVLADGTRAITGTLTVSGQVLAGDGTKGAPGFAFASIPSAGMFLRSSGLAFSPGSQDCFEVRANFVGIGGVPLLFSTGQIDSVAASIGLEPTSGNTLIVTDGSTGAGHIRMRSGGTVIVVPITPSQITGNVNDYAPGVAHHYRLSSDASRNITGLSIGQLDGHECEFWNVGAQNIVLKHDDAGSAAANQFLNASGADITLAANEMAFLRWFSAEQTGSGGWRVVKG